MTTGCIAVQHLQQEAMYRRHGIQFAVPPAMTKFDTQTNDESGIESAGDIGLDLTQSVRDIAKQGGPPGRVGVVINPFSPRPAFLRQGPPTGTSASGC